MSDSRPPTERTLLGTDDMMVWAQEFCRIFDGKTVCVEDGDPVNDACVDPGLMVGWFANAFEKGRTIGKQAACPHEDVYSVADDLYFCRDCGKAMDSPATLEEHFKDGFDESRSRDS